MQKTDLHKPTIPHPQPKGPLEERESCDVESFKRIFLNHLHYTLAKDTYSATRRDFYQALAYCVRDHMVRHWIDTQQRYYDQDVKRVYYLSMEYLIGRTLGNSLINLGLYDRCQAALKEIGLNLDDLREIEWDAGLGNGGLGRLAACFLDSMATLGIPAHGYGIRYEYGIFYQQIQDGTQIETPDNWLRYGNPWEIPRPEFLYPVYFYGHVEQFRDSRGDLHIRWVDADEVMAMAYDTPVPGYGNGIVNTMRLWSSRSSRGFELAHFHHGDYIRAVEEKNRTENITRVLYPNDNIFEGKELRLKQEYFLVSATLQDIIRRYKKSLKDIHEFADNVAIQLNDTHPALAIPELMRLLLDHEGLTWEKAWDITVRTFGFTNHTLLPEALEQWPESLVKHVLPRHLQIIFEINRRFLDQVIRLYPNDHARLSRMSLIEEGPEKRIRMANLSIVGSHKVNGVSELHSQLLKERVFPEFYDLYPHKFTNKTNGITPRRWLLKANPELAALISSHIGDKWITDLSELKKIAPLADNAAFRAAWSTIKANNKKRMAEYLHREQQIAINPNTLIDCQVKRVHEYKRQLLNILHVITLYNEIKDHPDRPFVPRTVLIGGKAAPSYFMAKLVIRLINAVSSTVNLDPSLNGKLALHFLENYRVSLAEKIIPATDLSEQISTAGTEASGTGNMKFALNGALTIGTLDGANIEIKQEVGDDNIFIFGLTAQDVADVKRSGYNPWDYYHKHEPLRRCLDMIRDGYFCPTHPDLFKPLFETLLYGGDHYLLLADYASYIDTQRKVSQEYQNQDLWIKKSIANVAHMGKFSSDRTILDYAEDVWGINR